MTRQCKLCGCEIPAVGNKTYCDSCAYTMKLARKRVKCSEMAEDGIVGKTRWNELSEVFGRFVYSVMSWEKHLAKEGLKG